ncbi:hypothetical protein CQ018_18810 [Arthrobacter sp. MYb227]|uniref:hypothetical protein n=1 Tax=Arthrobacter sp. MYb227 TaxID=1848601 RepID=UPI000CFBC524|nr:hypothetical protein [Arthrobacter sp. MYb227]PQZ86413.1 hypothetical protein CQ018_18810 [Arthrobacter sp. MYb227]
MKHHLGKNLTHQNHRSTELENHSYPGHPVLGHGQDLGQAGPHQVPLTLSEATDQAKATDEYIIPVHIVFLHQANTRRSAEPAQIPWLEELRADQYLSDLPSEVI